MANIKFHYLYRDGSNYKKRGEVVFSNDAGLLIASVEEELRDAFPGDGLFIADQARIPEVFLHTEDRLTRDDRCSHEFNIVEETPDAPNDADMRSIREFIDEVAKEAARGWQAFDPLDRVV